MHNYQKIWRPSPAAKPSHLTAKTADGPGMNLAALQGATSAFTLNTSQALPNIGNLRSHDEKNAATDYRDQRGRPGTLPMGAGEDNKTSPVRGRFLIPGDAAPASSGLSNPTRLDRSPSMIAARLVSKSANTSPVRNKSHATLSSNNSQSIASVPNTRLITTNSGEEKYSRPTSPVRRNKTNNTTNQDVALDFKQAPVLLPKPRVDTFIRKNTSSTGVLSSSTPTSRATADPRLSSTLPSKGTNHTSQATAPISIPRSTPAPPAPRKGRTLARSPLQADITGPRVSHGMSREQVINSMADAIVASSLASTRPPSPVKATHYRPTMARSVSARTTYRVPSLDLASLPTPARPLRPMKQTLRKESPEEDDEDDNRRGRRHLVRKHPNKHHEGDRKRWRDKVTESERRRYEGVFAANRGLFLKTIDPRESPSRLIDPNSEGNQVVNVVVRDIWERSRLSAHILEQIYDLVCPAEAQVLNREQFVVGLWLVDQKLKGRKLPVKVTESVWASVRHTHGLKLGSQSLQH